MVHLATCDKFNFMKKKKEAFSDLKHPTEFPSLSLSLLLFCILRID
jgi:hypothetical protein